MGRVTTRVPRVRFDAATGAGMPRPDTVVVEEPLELRVGATVVGTTMRTPGDDFDFALGHLLTEGLIRSADDVAGMMHCTDVDASGSPTFNVVDIALRAGVSLPPPRARTEQGTSACGVCGSRSVEDVRTSSPYAVGPGPQRLSPAVVAALPEALRERQAAFDKTGGVHAAGLATAPGELLAVREDIGRHNAVDKVLGAHARTHRPSTTSCSWSPRGPASRSSRRRRWSACRSSSRSAPRHPSPWGWRWSPASPSWPSPGEPASRHTPIRSASGSEALPRSRGTAVSRPRG